jgi:hypothetical protein
MQSIAFKYPGGAMVLDQPVTLSAQATSGLPVSFESTTPATCTVSGDQLTVLKVGECRVVARQPGGQGPDGSQWAAADEVSQLFNVLGRPQGPVVPVGVVLRASSETVTLSATTDAGLPAAYKSSTSSVCTVDGNTLTVMGQGLCQLTVTAPASDTYAAMSGTVLFPVMPVPPVVVQLQGKTQSVVLGKTDADGSALSYASTAPSVCEVVGNELLLKANGSCTFTLSKSGAASENLLVTVGPRFFASSFDAALKRTAEFGEINMGAGVPIASWCGAVSPSWCNVNVGPASTTFGFDIKPVGRPDWTGSTNGWWAYDGGQIGAPRKQVKDASGTVTGYELLPFDVKTEETMFVTLQANATMLKDGKGLFVRIRTNHYNKKADNSDCYVTVSVHLHPTSSAPTGYLIPFKDFAVTDKCEIPALPQTEGWMFDWGVSAESKAAALAEIRAYGIRELEFAPDSVNLTNPDPKADGSLPATNDPDYTLRNDITVFAPITVQ